ncbi:MAG: hypothetical protein NT023_02485, partial [Armatimonadetes bacterium]|nr:hypothetical protein [Armatimonadota bacterium]
EIYNNTLYLGTDAGLYSSHIGVNKHDFVERLNRRHDAPCLSASARYGTVKASCGQDGLYAAIEDFGGSLAPLEYVAPKSLRTGWLDYDIVNYPSQNAPTLIKTQHEKTDRSRYEEQNVLTKIGSHEINLDYLLDTLYVKHGVLKQEVQYTYNILTHLYVQTIDGACYSLSLSISNEEAVSTVHIKKYDHKLSRILSVNTCKAGQVIETENGIYLWVSYQ